MNYASCIIMHHECGMMQNAWCMMHLYWNMYLSLIGCLQIIDLSEDNEFDIQFLILLSIMHRASCIMDAAFYNMHHTSWFWIDYVNNLLWGIQRNWICPRTPNWIFILWNCIMQHTTCIKGVASYTIHHASCIMIFGWIIIVKPCGGV